MDSHQPLVSVIMPFYNTLPAFMVEAIESVRAQSYERWELLLIDDGSTNEASSATARSYVEADPLRIRLLEHPGRENRGLGAARQLADRHLAGELVAFLDADDLWLPNKLEEQAALMQGNPGVGALYGRTQYWYSWNPNAHNTLDDVTPPLGLPDGAILQPPALLGLFIEEQVAIPCTCSIMLRRSLLQTIGGFECGIRGFFYEDQMLYAKTCLHAPVLAMDRCWDRYRQHPESGTHRDTRQAQALHLAYLQWLARYLEQQNETDPAVWSALRRRLWLYDQPQWLPQPLHQPLRMGKKWLLRLQGSERPSNTEARRSGALNL